MRMAIGSYRGRRGNLEMNENSEANLAAIMCVIYYMYFCLYYGDISEDSA